MTVDVVDHPVRVIHNDPRLIVLAHRREVVLTDVRALAAIRDLEWATVPVCGSVRGVLVRLCLQKVTMGQSALRVALRGWYAHTFLINGSRSAQLHPGLSYRFAQSS